MWALMNTPNFIASLEMMCQCDSPGSRPALYTAGNKKCATRKASPGEGTSTILFPFHRKSLQCTFPTMAKNKNCPHGPRRPLKVPRQRQVDGERTTSVRNFRPRRGGNLIETGEQGAVHPRNNKHSERLSAILRRRCLIVRNVLAVNSRETSERTRIH